jgi:hypothetical protein
VAWRPLQSSKHLPTAQPPRDRRGRPGVVKPIENMAGSAPRAEQAGYLYRSRACGRFWISNMTVTRRCPQRGHVRRLSS